MAIAPALRGFALRCLIVVVSLVAFSVTGARAVNGTAAWPLQVWTHISSAPVAFPSDGGQHLLYELYLTNLAPSKVALTSVDIVDPGDTQARPLAHYAGKQLGEIARSLGHDAQVADIGKPIAIDAGETIVLFLEATVPTGRPVPRHLTQRLTYAGGEIVVGGVVETRSGPLKVLGPPVAGTDWIAADGPGNGQDNHHRRGLFIVDGAMRDSRRLAVDWKRVHGGSSFDGDAGVDSSYYAYRQPVLAVGDAVVVEVRDGAPDNPPGHGEHFHPAAPVTFDNAGGNTIVLDLGGGQYAHYYHLEAGSITVRKGDRVRRGRLIAQIGASGDAREPHLHFEVTNAIPLLAGEGVPYVIDRYRVIGGDGYKPGVRIRELPLDGMVINFAGPAR